MKTSNMTVIKTFNAFKSVASARNEQAAVNRHSFSSYIIKIMPVYIITCTCSHVFACTCYEPLKTLRQ